MYKKEPHKITTPHKKKNSASTNQNGIPAPSHGVYK